MRKKKTNIANELAPAVKPVAKAILKASLRLYDAAEERIADAQERLTDLVAEVRAEMNGKTRSIKRPSRRKPSPK